MELEGPATSPVQGKGIMRPFSESNPCPKCGTAKATVHYHGPDAGQAGCDPGEHIHRECSVCGYPWSDACIELIQPPCGGTVADALEVDQLVAVDASVAGEAFVIGDGAVASEAYVISDAAQAIRELYGR